MSGWGVPRPGLDGGGGYPGQVWMIGYPIPGLDGGRVPQPGLDGGVGTLSLGWGVPQTGLDGGGVPQPGLDGGVCTLSLGGGTPARSGWWGGVYPIQGLGWEGGYSGQFWMMGYPIPWVGIPHPRSGWWEDTPTRSGWWGGYPIPGVGGTPDRSGWGGVPQPGLDGGVGTLSLGWGGTPARTGWWGGDPPTPPIRQSSIASTCHAAGGMPLAFTQEDFLVVINSLQKLSVFGPLFSCSSASFFFRVSLASTAKHKKQQHSVQFSVVYWMFISRLQLYFGKSKHRLSIKTAVKHKSKNSCATKMKICSNPISSW